MILSLISKKKEETTKPVLEANTNYGKLQPEGLKLDRAFSFWKRKQGS